MTMHVPAHWLDVQLYGSDSLFGALVMHGALQPLLGCFQTVIEIQYMTSLGSAGSLSTAQLCRAAEFCTQWMLSVFRLKYCMLYSVNGPTLMYRCEKLRCIYC